MTDNVDNFQCGQYTRAGKPCRQRVDLLPCRFHDHQAFHALIAGLRNNTLPVAQLELLILKLQNVALPQTKAKAKTKAGLERDWSAKAGPLTVMTRT